MPWPRHPRVSSAHSPTNRTFLNLRYSGRSMAEAASASLSTSSHGPSNASHADPLSIPYLVAASVLIGAGIFTIFVWITSFAWPYFSGVFLLAIGALMLFSPRSGADRSA